MSVTKCRKTEENRGHHKVSKKLDKYENMNHKFCSDQSSFEKKRLQNTIANDKCRIAISSSLNFYNRKSHKKENKK